MNAPPANLTERELRVHRFAERIACVSCGSAEEAAIFAEIRAVGLSADVVALLGEIAAKVAAHAAVLDASRP